MILIDTREQFKQEIQAKFNKLNVPSYITKLENFTDYLIISDNEEVEMSVSVQRKQTGEYLSQMDEVRERISELLDNPTLLIEGKFQISVDGSIMVNRGKLLYEAGKVKSYFNSLNSLKLKGISIIETQSLEHTIWWLYSTHAYIQKHHYPKPSRKYNEDEEIMGALMGIKGIGDAKAKKIYEAFLAYSEETKQKPLIVYEDNKTCSSGDVVKSVDEKEEWEKEIDEEFGPTEEDELLDEI